MKQDPRWVVHCGTCGTLFDLRTAPWCEKHPQRTKLCPNGHCICEKLGLQLQIREATDEEKKYGFNWMLKEEYGGVREVEEKK